jgi:hypothetical protein
MAVSMAKAREVCNKAEMELVESSFSPAVKRLTPARLKSKIGRARKMADKFNDLSRKQNRSTKESASGRDNANARTALKATVFAETVERFERRLAEVDGSGSGGAS